MKPVSVFVPATSANLGPGFDALGVAVQLYNHVQVAPADSLPKDPFILEAAELFFKTIRKKKSGFSISITGSVPRSRGLGSSVTVRLGLLCALNKIHGSPLPHEKMLDLTVELEGHPDNAVPAFYGGFAAANKSSYFRANVSPKLYFVAAVPSFELETRKARSVLPKTIPRADVVTNIQNTGVIVAAFASKQYELLHNVMGDKLHQPYRAKLIPGFNETIEAAKKAGALDAYLSGAGSTIMALTLKNPEAVGHAMARTLRKAGDKEVWVKILLADNRGVRV